MKTSQIVLSEDLGLARIAADSVEEFYDLPSKQD